MTTIANPITNVAILLMFGVPIAILVVGVLVYSLKPKHRKMNGAILIVTGSIELLAYLNLTRNLTLVPIILYTLSLLAILVGVVSLKYAEIKPTT